MNRFPPRKNRIAPTPEQVVAQYGPNAIHTRPSRRAAKDRVGPRPGNGPTDRYMVPMEARMSIFRTLRKLTEKAHPGDLDTFGASGESTGLDVLSSQDIYGEYLESAEDADAAMVTLTQLDSALDALVDLAAVAAKNGQEAEQAGRVVADLIARVTDEAVSRRLRNEN